MMANACVGSYINLLKSPIYPKELEATLTIKVTRLSHMGNYENLEIRKFELHYLTKELHEYLFTNCLAVVSENYAFLTRNITDLNLLL